MDGKKLNEFLGVLKETPTILVGEYADEEDLKEKAFKETDEYIHYNFNSNGKIDPVYLFYFVKSNNVLMSGIPLSIHSQESKEESMRIVKVISEVLHVFIGSIIMESWMMEKKNIFRFSSIPENNPIHEEVVISSFSGISKKIVMYKIKRDKVKPYLEFRNVTENEKYLGTFTMENENFN